MTDAKKVVLHPFARSLNPPRVPMPHDVFLRQKLESDFRWRHTSAKGVSSEMRRRGVRFCLQELRRMGEAV